MRTANNTRNRCIFRKPAVVLATVFCIGLGSAPPGLAQEEHSYLVDLNTKQVTTLGSLGNNHTVAEAINNSGQVVGQSRTSNDERHAFITGANGAGMTDLGTLGGRESYAFGINASGRVVGRSETSDGNTHAFITGPNGMGMTDLGTLGGKSTAYGINAAGQVAGEYTGDGRGHAFITGPNGMGMTDLGTLGGFQGVAAYDINAVGQVAGQSGVPAPRRYGYTHAFITGPNGTGMTDLGTLALGGTNSIAEGINATGQVVGWSTTNGKELTLGHAFITGPNGRPMTDLGTLGGRESYAFGINASGRVVGRSETSDGNAHAFITGPNGVGMMDLNSVVHVPGVVFTEARGINDAGQVIAIAFLPIIPEPETYALLLAGLALIGFIARRKKMSEAAFRLG